MYVDIHESAFHTAINTLQIPWQDSMIGKQISSLFPSPPPVIKTQTTVPYNSVPSLKVRCLFVRPVRQGVGKINRSLSSRLLVYFPWVF